MESDKKTYNQIASGELYRIKLASVKESYTYYKDYKITVDSGRAKTLFTISVEEKGIWYWKVHLADNSFNPPSFLEGTGDSMEDSFEKACKELKKYLTAFAETIK